MGFVSFIIPWVSFTASNGVVSVVDWESPAQLLADVVTAPSAVPASNPALLAWEQSAGAGFGIWTVGAILFLAGCFVLLGQAFASFRWGGVFLLGGTVVSLAGILSFSTSFTYAPGLVAAIWPTYGVGPAVLASIVGLVPLFRVDPEDRWIRYPQGAGQERSDRSSDGSPLFGRLPRARSGDGVAPGSDLSDMAAPRVSRPSDVASQAAPTRRVCPTCGARYLGGETACPRDGTALKPVLENAMPGQSDEVKFLP